MSRYVRSYLPPLHHRIIGEKQNEARTAALLQAVLAITAKSEAGARLRIAKQVDVDPAIIVMEDIEAPAAIARAIIGARLLTA